MKRGSLKTIEFNIQIQKLLLRGIDPVKAKEIANTVQTHLQSLILEKGLSTTLEMDTSSQQVDGGQFQMNNESPSIGIGESIAQNVYMRLCEQLK